MASLKDSGAKDFLIKIGLEGYVDELVNKNKFETLSDLELLTDLDDNMFEKIRIPLCVVLKIRSKMRELSTGQAEDNVAKHEGASESIKAEPVSKELTKSDLLKLQSESMDAQYANLQFNAFTSVLAAKVNECQHQGKWQGAGGLRVSAGTSNKEAQENCVLADSILADIQYGTYTVRGHGVLTLDRKRAKAFIGNKLAHLRKPSAYKRKTKDTEHHRHSKMVRTAATTRKIEPLSKESSQPLKEGSSGKDPLKKGSLCKDPLKKGSSCKDPLRDGSSHTKVNAELLTTGDEDLAEIMEEKGNSDEENNEEESAMLKQRRLNMEANNNHMLQIGLLTASQATIVTLFHLKVTKYKSVQMKRLREECKKHNLTYNKSSKKEELCAGLGKLLFNKEITRIDEDKSVSFENLKFI